MGTPGKPGTYLPPLPSSTIRASASGRLSFPLTAARQLRTYTGFPDASHGARDERRNPRRSDGHWPSVNRCPGRCDRAKSRLTSSQQRAERCAVPIADRRGDLFDRLLRRAQAVHRGLDPQVLNVRQRRPAEHGPDAALEGALAGPHAARRGREGEVHQVAARPALEALDDGVVVRQVVGHHVGGLRWALVEHEVACDRVRQRRAALAHEPQRQIDVRQGRAGGHDTRRLHDHPRLVQRYPGKELAEERRKPPGGRCLAVVEDPRTGQHERRRADNVRTPARVQPRSRSQASSTSRRSSAARRVSRVLHPSAGTMTRSGRGPTPAGASATRSPCCVRTARDIPHTTTS